MLAECPTVFVRSFWLIARNKLLSLNPTEVVLLYEDKGAGANLPASRAVTGAHHAWRIYQFELDRSAATTSVDHVSLVLWTGNRRRPAADLNASFAAREPCLNAHSGTSTTRRGHLNASGSLRPLRDDSVLSQEGRLKAARFGLRGARASWRPRVASMNDARMAAAARLMTFVMLD